MNNKKLYELTPSHKKKLKPWTEKWIKHILNCDSMSEEEKEICRNSVIGLYRSANLYPPPKERIIFVSSPIQAAFVAAISNCILWMRDNNIGINNNAVWKDDTEFPTDAASAAAGAAAFDAVHDAVHDAVYAATDAAAFDAVHDAVHDAVYAATDAAAFDAVHDAVYAATASFSTLIDLSKWYAYPQPYSHICKTLNNKFKNKLEPFLNNVMYLHNGGNFWGQYVSFLTFFRYVAKLKIDYSTFDYYEKLAIHSGSRFMHKKFCIISDRPLFIKQDDQHRPHCDTGPYIKWRDGAALYCVHGVRVPAWIIEQPDKITVQSIEDQENAEIKRIMIDKYGLGNYINKSGSVELHQDEFGILYRKDVENDESIVTVCVVNSTPELDGTHKKYWLRVPPNMKTAKEAVAWTFGFEGNEYNPIIET